MFDSLKASIHDAMMVNLRRRYGLDTKSDEELQALIVTLLSILPADRLKALVERRSKSPRLTDRKNGQKLALVLFAQAEIRRLEVEVTPDEMHVLFREALEELQAEPSAP